MSLITFDLINGFAIDQGRTWRKASFLIGKNFSSWYPEGQIRTDYIDNGGILKAEFKFLPITWQEVQLRDQKVWRSLIIPYLDALDTESLFIPRKRFWVYDITLSQGSERIELTDGLVSINPRVTVHDI